MFRSKQQEIQYIKITINESYSYLDIKVPDTIPLKNVKIERGHRNGHPFTSINISVNENFAGTIKIGKKEKEDGKEK